MPDPSLPPGANSPAGEQRHVSAAPPADARRTGLTLASLAALLMLLAQAGLGAGVAFLVRVPSADLGGSLLPAIGHALADGPAALAAHAALGLLLVVTALSVLVRAILTRSAALTGLSAVGLLAIVGAVASGARFVAARGSSASVVMGACTVIALAVYALNLYLLRASRVAVTRQVTT